MSVFTSPRALLTFFFMLFALLSSSFSAPLSPLRRDVWVPKIICPTSSTVWSVGGDFYVTWDTSSEPDEVTNPYGDVYLRHNGETQSNPLASGFLLSDGKVQVTVPQDTIPGTWEIVLFGDSGNFSDDFSIEAAS